MARGAQGVAEQQVLGHAGVTVRHLWPFEGVPDEVLGGLPRGFRLNPEWTLVAVDHLGEIVGLAVLYGCGHSAVFLEPFVVHPRVRGGAVGVQLMRACVELVQRRGYHILCGATMNQQFVRRAKLAGAVVSPESWTVLAFPVAQSTPDYQAHGERARRRAKRNGGGRG